MQPIVRVSGAGTDPDSDIAIARLQGRCDRVVIDSGIACTLTGAQALTNARALAVIAGQVGRPVRPVAISGGQAVEGMCQAGMPEPPVQAMSSRNRVIAAGWVAEVMDDVPRLLGGPATAWDDLVAEQRAVWH